MREAGWRQIAIGLGVLAIGLVVPFSALLLSPPPAEPVLPEPSAVDSPAANAAAAASLTSSSPGPEPAASPSAAPSPTAARLAAGDLPPDSAAISYAPETGIPTNIEQLQASCNLAGDSLGLVGSYLGGPLIARYQVTIAPFRGDGQYRTDASQAQIGGDVSITGQVQLFIGPPYVTVADVGRDGALGRLKFSGTGIDGRRAEGVVRWECSDVKRLRP